MRTPETVPENQDIINIANELDILQAKENEGRGISCVKTIVAYLKMGKLEDARTICHTEHDKIVSYPTIKNFLKEKLFKGINNHPWKFLDSL